MLLHDKQHVVLQDFYLCWLLCDVMTCDWLSDRTCAVSSLSSVVFQMVIGQQSSGSSSNLTELQVVNLDAAQNSKSD